MAFDINIFNPDADWEYIVIKEMVTIYPFINEAYNSTPVEDVEAFPYDRNSDDGEEDSEKTEIGWVLRASTCGALTNIVQRTLIVQDDGTQWQIFGKVELLTAKTRFRVSAVKVNYDLNDIQSGLFNGDMQLVIGDD